MKYLWLILALGVICTLPVRGEGLSGYDVVQKAYNRDDGRDSAFTVEMILVDKQGNERRRTLTLYVKDYDKLIKSFMEFQDPDDIRDVRFLIWEQSQGDDTQYLYLPALGRARRIVSSQKNLRFVNTDYTYEDMQRRKPDEDTHTLIGEEVCGDFDCYVIESVPDEGNSQYTKRTSWIEKKSFVVVRTDFYGKKGKKIKEFRVDRLSNEDGIWTARRTYMRDLEHEHTTIMIVVDVTYNQGLEDEIFSLRQLEAK